MYVTVPFPSSPIWRRVWGSQQLDKRSQLENLPQPDQHHVDQHESHDIAKILFIIFIVLSKKYFSLPWLLPCCWSWCSGRLWEKWIMFKLTTGSPIMLVTITITIGANMVAFYGKRKLRLSWPQAVLWLVTITMKMTAMMMPFLVCQNFFNRINT